MNSLNKNDQIRATKLLICLDLLMTLMWQMIKGNLETILKTHLTWSATS